MHVTFRQLQLFLALADHKSITAAARACHVTQPTVSMQLRELADAVGLPLYEQIGKKLHLTEAGEALVDTARAMGDEWGAFEQRVHALRGLTQGRLRLAVVSTAQYFVPGLLGRFCASHPEIDIALELMNRDAVVERLRHNRDDLYIMSQPPADIELERHAFLPNPLVVIAPLGHRLLARRRLALRDLATERFIMRERGSGTRLACDAHFKGLGFAPEVRLELGSNEAIKQSVAAGLGLAVISRHALAASPHGEGLAELAVPGFPIQSSWWTLHPKGKRLSPLARVFLDYIGGTARDWQAQATPAPGRALTPSASSRRPRAGSAR